MSKLQEAARLAMCDVLALNKGEEVVIVSDFDGDAFPIARALFEQTRAIGGRPTIVVQPQKTSLDNAERAVLEAIRSEPDIIIGMGSGKVGKDPFGTITGYIGRDGKKYSHIWEVLLDGNRRARSFWSPGATVDMFERCVNVDYHHMQALAARLKAVFDDGSMVHVTSPAGTDIRLSIEGRKGQVDDGDFRSPGKGGNLPCGEAFVSPKNESAEGVIVFDGTVDLIPKAVIPDSSVRVKYERGFVSEVAGGPEATELLKVIQNGEKMARELGLKAEERNARALGELGVGINPAARMTCNMLEDEKVGRTVHFAIGMNLDNDANALIHQDCLVLRPSMWVDDRQIMRDGDILI
jgi:aminopeptidase